jgi:hypothetical protein
MNFLGMLENADRLSKLLVQANICSLDEVAALSREDCVRLKLPWDLINALQTRQRTWALELVDEAEMGLEQGEKFYNITAGNDSPRIKAKANEAPRYELPPAAIENPFQGPMQGNVMFSNTVPGNMMPGNTMPGGMSMSPMPQAPMPGYPGLENQMNMQMYPGNMMQDNMNMSPMGPMTSMAVQPMLPESPPAYAPMPTNRSASVPPIEDVQRDRSPSMTMFPPTSQSRERPDRANMMSETRIAVYDQMPDNTHLLEALDKKLGDQNSMIVDMVSRQQQDNTLLQDMLGKKLGEMQANMWDKVCERVDFISQNMGSGIQDMAKSLEKFQMSMEKSQAVLEAKMQYGLPASNSPNQDHDRREQERRDHDRREQERREQERREQDRRDNENWEQERRVRERSQDPERRACQEDSVSSVNLVHSIRNHVEQCLAQSVEKILQTSSAIEDSNAASFRSMENMLVDVFEKLDVVKTSQQALLSNMGGESISQMTDGWTKNIIHQVAQENKATAFTLQARMTLIDETNSKKLGEIEERLGQRFHHMTKETTGGLHNLVTHQTQLSTDKLCGAIEAWKGGSSNESIRLEQKISDLATYMNQESSKQIEASLAVFQNTLRVQIDTMHTAQLGLARDSDANVATKLHNFVGDMQRKVEKIDMFEATMKDVMHQLSQEQTEKISMLSANIRDFMRYQGGRNSMSGNDDGSGRDDGRNSDRNRNDGIEWTLNRLASVADQPHHSSPNRTERQRPGTANSSTRPRSSGTGTRMTYT